MVAKFGTRYELEEPWISDCLWVEAQWLTMTQLESV